jgi:hypothetical protein
MITADNNSGERRRTGRTRATVALARLFGAKSNAGSTRAEAPAPDDLTDGVLCGNDGAVVVGNGGTVILDNGSTGVLDNDGTVVLDNGRAVAVGSGGGPAGGNGGGPLDGAGADGHNSSRSVASYACFFSGRSSVTLAAATSFNNRCARAAFLLVPNVRRWTI